MFEGTSRWTQHAATVFSGIGASLEVGLTALGCVDGPPGAVAGFALGNAIHEIVTNPIETALSYVSLGTGIVADVYSGRTRVEVKSSGKVNVVIGEAPLTSGLLTFAGGFMPIGVFDLGIDATGSAYTENLIGGVYNPGLESFPDWAVRGTGGFIRGAALGTIITTPVLASTVSTVTPTIASAAEEFVSNAHLLYDVRDNNLLPNDWPVQIHLGDKPPAVPPERPDWFPVIADYTSFW